MANLNQHDILLLGSSKFVSLFSLLEEEYGFRILSYDFPPFVSFTSKKSVLYTDLGTFFLKEKPYYCSDKGSRDRMAFFQNSLADSLPIVMPILPTINGQYYVEWNNRFFFLTKFKTGRVFNGSGDDITHMLEALKNFHEAGKIFSAKRSALPQLFKKTKSYKTLKVFSIVENNKELNIASEKISRIRQIIDELILIYDSIHITEYVMSHGDFSLFNMLLDDERVIIINDFDNVGFFPRVHDLAEFLVSASLIHYLGSTSNLRLPVFTKPDKNTFNAILTFYSKHMNLSNTEIQLLAIVSEIVWLEILLLSIIKEDYLMSDISVAEEKIRNGFLREKITQYPEWSRTKMST